MDFLLGPNVVFLLLLTGVLLGVLAALTPGTGLLEISAFFCLAGAGYGAYNLPFNWWALLILALSTIPIIFAFQKSRRELWLGLSILGLVGGAALVFASVNPLLALIASGMAGAFLWIAVRKSVQATQSRPVHDLKAL